MTQPTTANPVDVDYKPMPSWLAITIIVMCVVASGALLWWWFGSERRPILVDLPNASRPVRTVPDDNWNNDARSLGGGNWAIRSGEARMFVNRRDDKNNVRFVYGNDLVTGEDRAMIRVAALARRDDGAKQLALTQEQKATLTKLPRLGATTMTTNKDDIANAQTAWGAFESAPDDKKDEAKKTLLALVKEIGDQRSDESKAALAAQVAAVKAALTPEQIEKAKKVQ